jgi:hypothetical protein
MSLSARFFWAIAVLVLISQIAVFGSNGSFQEPAADSSDKAKTQQTSKSSKKRKKKKAVASVPYVVFSPSPQTPVTSSPITINSVEALPTTPLPAARNVFGAEKTPGVHVSPTGIAIEPPLGPALGTATAGQLVISEFRVRGINGPQDEFIEIYNTTGADHTVAAASGTGYGIAASDGVTRCSIPNGTVIPNKGHYLCVNSVGFSLGAYPAGSGTIGTGDATYTTDIPDNAGIALFNNNTGGGSYILANRLDAVGSTSEANTTYKEGTGYPSLVTPAFNINYSFYRDNCGKGGSITILGPCPSGGLPIDTNNNAADFIFVDANGTSAGAGQRLGSPGPEGLSSPIQRNGVFAVNYLDATVAGSIPPNRVRDFTSDPANNSTFGTLSIRRRFVNNTGANVTRLRFRVVDQTTFPAPSGFADLRTRTSGAVVVAGINDSATCAATGAPATPPCTATVQGTTLEQAAPPANQPNGGAFNGSYSAGTVTLGTPLANGASINLQFLLGLQQTGTFKFFINIEALP